MNRLLALEAFVRVVDCGSFSGAAKHLRLGQPAISKAIAELEERAGVRLLLRSTHGVSQTEGGELFYVHAKHAVEEAELADLAARGSEAALVGRLRVCAAVTFARLHVIPHMGEFLTTHSLLDVDLQLDDHNVDLIEAGADVALRMGELTTSSYSARKICDAPRLLVATPSYLERMGEPQTPTEVANHQMIIHDVHGGVDTWAFTKGSIKTSVATKSRFRVSATEGVREAVLSDLGVTIAPSWMFSPELANGRVRALLSDWTLPRIDLWGVFPPRGPSNTKARTFVDFIKSRLDRTPAVHH